MYVKLRTTKDMRVDKYQQRLMYISNGDFKYHDVRHGELKARSRLSDVTISLINIDIRPYDPKSGHVHIQYAMPFLFCYKIRVCLLN